MFLLSPRGFAVDSRDTGSRDTGSRDTGSRDRTALADAEALTLHWSASDLTLAAECEYALLRKLDYQLGRADGLEIPEDPLLEHIARLGDDHEAEILADLRSIGRVAEISRVPQPFTRAALTAAQTQTVEAFASQPDVVFQAAFFDGEFFGYADFVERTADGWLVCDAKLARHAKPKALIQLGAYADQLVAMGLRLSPVASLLLGSGERVDFPLSEVLPAFRERRERLRELLSSHRSSGSAVQWGSPDLLACGRCEECRSAAELSNDVLLVAGARMDQRRQLRETGITTLADLALADDAARPDGMAPATFDKLRAQASLQWEQRQAGSDSPVRHELTERAGETLALLPAASPGDVFFDFEGDPMYHEGDRSRYGLEYLWGLMTADGDYRAIWAHDSHEERDALIDFIGFLTERRRQHPEMHVYHYAPYETTALKRLAIRYQVLEAELDNLLRAEIFVDLYATVRSSVRVSASSYSIKKLEPLYMGGVQRRADENAVGDGGASVVAYHQYRAMRIADPQGAIARLEDLAAYNRDDCLSTLRLRDWLLERATEAGVRDQIVPRTGRDRVEPERAEDDHDGDPLVAQLLAMAEPARGERRSTDEQALAMLASAAGYFRREEKTFWWEHFDRLQTPVEEWADSRDVFTVESAHVAQNWAVPTGRARNARRTLTLIGDWAPGSKESSKAFAIYSAPYPAHAFGPEGALYAYSKVEGVVSDPLDHRLVRLTESQPPGQEFEHTPIALSPAPPPQADVITAAIKRVGQAAVDQGGLPNTAALDILARRSPRLRDGAPLPSGGESTQTDVVAALLAMDDSYLAVQGPPGTGKTYVGSRAIKELVERHHWRIGVVAQSHAAVENMLKAIIDDAGLAPDLVGKSKTERPDAPWVEVKDSAARRHAFLVEHVATGCVLGGTAWTFSHPDLVGEEPLDLLVIDEAGQFALAHTIGAATSAKRLLLLGDPQQLPQVSQGSHAEPVNESALGWLMAGEDTLPPDLGYFLATTHRMHPALCRKVSSLAYDGRLVAAADAAARNLDGVPPGLRAVMVDHHGNRVESEEEAAAVVEIVRGYLGRTWTDPDDPAAPRPLTQADFLVVAPYNAQVALIGGTLRAAGLTEVRVGTVDKFQGQEAPIAIVSMTASSYGDVPRGMGFLLNRNRVNVAISRAKWQAVLVRSRALTSYMPTSAEGVLELGAFIGLCS